MILSTYLEESTIIEEMELNKVLSESIEYEYLSEETQNGIVTKFKALVEKVRKIITQIYNKIKQLFQNFRKKLPMYKKYNKEVKEIITLEVESVFDLNDPKRISGKMDYIYDEILDCADKLKQNLGGIVVGKMDRYIENDFEFLKTKLNISQEPKTYKFNAEEYIDKFRDWETLLNTQYNDFYSFSLKLARLRLVVGKQMKECGECVKAVGCMVKVFNKVFFYLKDLCNTCGELVLQAEQKVFKKQFIYGNKYD